jgi:hypothetical protein
MYHLTMPSVSGKQRTHSCRQRQLIALGNRLPTMAPDTWIAPDAVIIGDVDLYDRVHAVAYYQGCAASGRQLLAALAWCIASALSA